MLSEAELRERVQAGVDRVLARQNRTGGFGAWSASGYDPWLDAYATDVLLRAEAQGAAVPPQALRLALDNLRNRAAQAGSLHDGAAGAAYAFYVLARAGEAAIGDLRYYADTLADRFDTPLAAAHLGAALAAYGERARADAMLTRARDLALAGAVPDGWRDDYGTVLRDRAGVLALAVEAGTGVVDRLQLAGLLARRAPVHHLSTQEAAWSLRAAVAMGAAGQGLIVDGSPVTGDAVRWFDGTPATVRNAGAAPSPSPSPPSACRSIRPRPPASATRSTAATTSSTGARPTWRTCAWATAWSCSSRCAPTAASPADGC
jgi:alpha-2-macroglobulin